MTSYTQLNVFRYVDNRSDKLWVIGVDQAGSCVTWFGRAVWRQHAATSSCRLRQGGATVSGSMNVLINKKLKKGYTHLEHATFDPTTMTVTIDCLSDARVSDIPILPSMIAIDCHAPTDVVLSACVAIEDRVAEYLPEYLEWFHRLAVVEAIVTTRALPSSCDYEQGPLALCFLVAMKRRINRLSSACALFLDNGSELGNTYSEWSQIARFMSAPDGFELRTVAEAMGAIDAPIDFRALTSAVPAAFV